MKTRTLGLLTAGWLAGLMASAGAAELTSGSIHYIPDHSNGVYAAGETVGWTLELAPGTELPSTPLSYTVLANGAETVKTGTLTWTNGRARIDYVAAKPETILVKIENAGLFPVPTSTAPAFAFTKDATLGAVVDPLKIGRDEVRPADFDAFWKEKLAKQRAMKLNAQDVAVPQDNPAIALSTVTVAALGSTLHGYVAAPTRPGKYPALIIYQYAGVYALQPWTVTSRAAQGWLALDVDSHDMAPDAATGVTQGYQVIGDENRETSYFLAMYLRDSRAIDYIASRPDWDGHTIVIIGTSMGGQQSLVTAGLNPDRVTAVLVNEPAGADFTAGLHGRKPGYPSWPTDDAKAMATGPYFDTINFARNIRAPLLMGIGFIDGTCPPAGLWTAFNQVSGAKEVYPMIESDHNYITPDRQVHFEAHMQAILDQLRSGQGFTPNPNHIDQPE